MSLRMHGQVWRKLIVQSFPNMSRKVVERESLWFVGFDTTLYRAKRPCRHTSCPFQSQYCQMMILWWFMMIHTNPQAWFGVLGARTPSRQQFSEPYLLVSSVERNGLLVGTWPWLWAKTGCVSFVRFIGSELMNGFQVYETSQIQRLLDILEKHPNTWRLPVSNAQEAN